LTIRLGKRRSSQKADLSDNENEGEESFGFFGDDEDEVDMDCS